MNSPLIDQLLNPKPTWFEVKTKHTTFIVSRARVGGLRYSHIPGNIHTVTILWTDGAETVVFQSMSDEDAATTLEMFKRELITDV